MVAVVLVCHHGELELKASFLIYSIRKYLRGNYSVYVALPEENPFLAEPSPDFFRFIKKYNIEIFRFRNQYLDHVVVLKEGDLVSNKIYACLNNFKEEYLVFLDSDTVLIQELDIEELIKGTKNVRMKPANRNNIKYWEEIYKDAMLQVPIQYVEASIDKTRMPPYFNSGVIIINNQIRSELVECWLKYYLRLSEGPRIRRIGYPVFNRDQVSLALAVVFRKFNYSLLDQAYNFPVRGKKISNKKLPYIVHYHNPFSIYFEKSLKKEFIEFKCRYPEFLNKANDTWHHLFQGKLLEEKAIAWLEFLKFSKYRLKNAVKNIIG